MMTTVRTLSAFLRRFRRAEDGNVAIEAMIILPLVFWAYLGMFSIFDAYRQYTNNQKATYTISDMISRQATPLDAGFLDGARDLFDELTRAVGDSHMRVSVVQYNGNAGDYEIVWSQVRGDFFPLTTTNVADWDERLPVMPHNDQIIVVETSTEFDPLFDLGLANRDINNFVFTRPRYAKQLCYDVTCGIITPYVVTQTDID
ncbi:TadE/TadG family type IV pilus assembly protein [uncultured Roseobacter sp.]|uniref:TadE/TadG family type IV pilus assembly protein n=1 Tax=uncultured Roseobacter sp. TaxID=114847 RepID=UPI0026179BBB|nr:TadE/TadG family type IV pilus assembly protein [uncultured Roseobacter sp.]